MKNTTAIVICLCLVLCISGCTSSIEDKSAPNESSVSKYSEMTGRYYEETSSGYKAAFYEKDEIEIEKIENWLTSCSSGENYYQYIYSDPDSWDMFLYYSPIDSGIQYSGFSFTVDGSTVKIYISNDGTPNDVSNDYLLIRVQAPLRGAWPSSSELYVNDEKIEIHTNTSSDDKLTSNENMDFASNPYEKYSERSDYWRYNLFEIFRGVEMVSFDDRLDYEKDYSQVITYEEQDDVLHEFKCKISLPQATENEPWTVNINAYYQEVLSELITEGNETWNLYYDDWAIHELSYHYENAYKHENIITIVRSCNFYGWRPSISWEPFTELFSARDGQKLYLDDLFCVERDEYLSILLELLSNATIYGTDYKPTFQGGIANRLDDASVAVTKAGLVFIYPIGAVSDMASGIVFLEVSYEDLQGLLNPIYFPNHVD